MLQASSFGPNPEAPQYLWRLERGLRALPGPIAVLFRDDDVVDLSPALEQLLEPFRTFNVPIHLAMIPCRLSPGGAAELRRLKHQGHVPIEFGQHGFAHTNYAHTGSPYEFGPCRSYAQQFDDIALGKARMEQYFQTDSAPVFTPPYYGYDRHTLRAIDALGFRVLSAGPIPLLQRHRYAFREVSMNLDPIATYAPTITYKPLDAFVAEILRAASAKCYLCFVLHHELFPVSMIAFLQGMLDILARQRHIVFYHLGAYAADIGASPGAQPGEALRLRWRAALWLLGALSQHIVRGTNTGRTK